MAKLTAKGRKRIKQSNFAIPEKRKYPIHTANHARNALARVSQHGSPTEKRRVRAAVKRKYPSISVGGQSRKRKTKKRKTTRRRKSTRKRRRRY